MLTCFTKNVEVLITLTIIVINLQKMYRMIYLNNYYHLSSCSNNCEEEEDDDDDE